MVLSKNGFRRVVCLFVVSRGGLKKLWYIKQTLRVASVCGLATRPTVIGESCCGVPFRGESKGNKEKNVCVCGVGVEREGGNTFLVSCS